MSSIKRLGSIFQYIHQHPLAGKHKSRAYYKFFRWQLMSRLKPGVHKVKFVGDTVLMVDRNMKGATGNIYLGLHDFNDMTFLIHFLRSDDLFIDIGANVGSYTILAAGVSKASCISFEPVPFTYQSLLQNVRANSLEDKVQCLNKGVGGGGGFLYFTKAYDCVNHVIPEKSIQDFSKVVQVPVVALDEVCNSVNKPMLIKIDVEGFETEVLRGMNQLLANNYLKGIIIELNGSGARYGYNESDLHHLLLSNRFKPYTYDGFKRELTLVDSFGSFNTIYLKDIQFVQQRLSSAPTIHLFSENF